MSRLMVGVSGVRGVVGETLTAEVAERFGRAFATMLGAGKRVVLGRDTRPSGPMIREAVVAGVSAGGVDVVDLGVVSTPGVALMIKRLGADGGIVITASHNPPAYNGIKFMTPEGLNLPPDRAGRVKEIWQSGDFSAADRPGRVSTDDRTHAEHVAAVAGIVDVEAVRARRFKVVLDSINGAGCVGGRMLLERLGAEVVHINGEPTGAFAHEPEPVAAHLGGLCEAASELRRRSLDLLRRGRTQEAESLLDKMDTVYDLLVTFDFPDAITGGLRRRVDQLRGVLERTRGDLTQALRQDRLLVALARFEEQVGGQGEE